MKKIFILIVFVASMACMPFCVNAQAASDETVGNVPTSEVTVVSDTADVSAEQLHSLIQAEVKKMVKSEVKKWEREEEDSSFEFEYLVAMLGLLLPLMLLVVFLEYNHKNKKAKYEVMKEALEHGQSVAPFLEKEVNQGVVSDANDGANSALWQKGIKTFCIGLGVSVFLYLITDLKLASIGILIMCVGAGQMLRAWFPSPNTAGKRFRREPMKAEEDLFRKSSSLASSCRPTSADAEAPVAKEAETESEPTVVVDTEEKKD